jgi:hypothetical protein
VTSTSESAAYLRPGEVAAILKCSEWWVKEQARRRRIPFSWIGGSYLFTRNHVAEIVALFETRPAPAHAATPAAPVRPVHLDSTTGAVIQLRPRAPHRGRAGISTHAA